MMMMIIIIIIVILFSYHVIFFASSYAYCKGGIWHNGVVSGKIIFALFPFFEYETERGPQNEVVTVLL